MKLNICKTFAMAVKRIRKNQNALLQMTNFSLKSAIDLAATSKDSEVNVTFIHLP